ncbi:AraC family transcriptional regulator [Paenibacillus chitinolyticus]|uniref:AraC family transcriptional regulator n=1 Tax=Paenibacillus chitinolyticus TaxID=79263 RepID=UPI00366B958F
MDVLRLIRIWNQVMVRVLDVRLKQAGIDDDLNQYRLPASAFLFAFQGQGELWVNDEVWMCDRFYVLHAGKGSQVTVRSRGALNVYIVLYKASLPASASREFHMMMRESDPFLESWGFPPGEPLGMLELLETIRDGWLKSDDGLTRLSAKGDFIRFVHAVLRERLFGAGELSLSEQVIRYLSRNYRQPISFEELARQLNYSQQYISRKCKEQTGLSPLDYVIRFRMEDAKALLAGTMATQQEIASHVGYPDLIYFSRMFKKYTGMTPGQYRKRYGQSVSDYARNTSQSSVVPSRSLRYPFHVSDIDYQSQQDGANKMTRANRSFYAAMLLCLTVMLTACGGLANNGGATHSQVAVSASPTAIPQESEASASSGTKIVTTAFGDVEVPAHPKRVAAISYLGTVLALDVQPIASESFLMSSPYLEGMLNVVTDVGDSFEKLLELNPDLIITHNPRPEIVEKYQKIAPTVSVPYNQFASIQEEMLYFGDLLDRRKEAERWNEQFEKEIADIRKKVQQTVPEGKTLSIMQEYDKNVSLFGPKSGRGGRLMYEIMGLKPPTAVPEYMLKESYYKFSLEKLPEYMGDYLILTTEASLKSLQADPIWGSLEPIRNNRVFLWTENQSWYRDPIAVKRQIKELTDWIIETASR